MVNYSFFLSEKYYIGLTHKGVQNTNQISEYLPEKQCSRPSHAYKWTWISVFPQDFYIRPSFISIILYRFDLQLQWLKRSLYLCDLDLPIYMY